jgi:dipeptidyl aminopeptidase/acylaminoacyl peptidase
MKLFFVLFIFCITTIESDAKELTHKSFLNVTSCFDGWSAHFSMDGPVTVPLRPEFSAQLSELKKQYDDFKNTAVCEYFDYMVGNIMVRGYYLAPKLLDLNVKLPLLINNRGGNRDLSAVTPETILHHIFPLVKEGFVIVGSQYRGFIKNIPNSGADEFGGRDLDDVLTLIDLASHFPKADHKKIGMLGRSRGGMMTYMTAKKSDKISAIAVVGGVTDLKKLMAFRPVMETVYKELIPNYAQEKEDALYKRSAIEWADKINKDIPILILHGANDERVHVTDALDIAKALSSFGHPYKLIIYENDDHYLSKHQPDVIKELSVWFKSKLN